nr:hypothetical protein [Actinomycetota bacterium]
MEDETRSVRRWPVRVVGAFGLIILMGLAGTTGYLFFELRQVREDFALIKSESVEEQESTIALMQTLFGMTADRYEDHEIRLNLIDSRITDIEGETQDLRDCLDSIGIGPLGFQLDWRTSFGFQCGFLSGE